MVHFEQVIDSLGLHVDTLIYFGESGEQLHADILVYEFVLHLNDVFYCVHY